MAETTTPKKTTARKTTAKKPTAKPRTAAARSTAPARVRRPVACNRTKAAAKTVRTDRKAVAGRRRPTRRRRRRHRPSAAGCSPATTPSASRTCRSAPSLTARDNVVETVEELRAEARHREAVEKELRKLEKRGEIARTRATREVKKARTRVERELRQRRNRVEREVKRNRTRVEREVRSLRKDAEQQIKDVRPR